MSAAASGAAAAAAAAERRRVLRLEEETMTDYAPKDLDGWQFKIFRGSFKTVEHLQALQAEQAQYGWTLLEVFDQERVRFKRPASEVTRDSERFSNPYSTRSETGGMSQEKVAVYTVLVIVGIMVATFCVMMALIRR